MIGKLILTLLLISGLFGYLRAQQRSADAPRRPPALADSAAARWQRRWPLLLLALLLIISAALFWLQWQEQHRLFNVRVVNVHTGEVEHYVAYRDDIFDRRFRTLEGRVVNLADIERMEVVVAEEGAATAMRP